MIGPRSAALLLQLVLPPTQGSAMAAIQVTARAPAGSTWLHVRARLAGTTVRRVVVETPTADGASSNTAELRVAAGVAAGTVAVPVGPGRIMTLRGFDAIGQETHRAVETLDLIGVSDITVSVSLLPIEEERPDSVRAGRYQVRVVPTAATLVVGQTVQLSGVVLGERGDTLPAAVRWKSTGPGLVMVTADGLVTAVDTGVVDVVATFGPAGAAAKIRIGRPFGATGCGAALVGLVVARINDERRKAGLLPLALDARLNRAAERHSADMAAGNFLGHTGSGGWDIPRRMADVGFPWIRVAENVAGGQETADEVAQAWMSSPGHRANILDPAFRQIGVGFAAGEASKFLRYWTADFGLARDGGKPVEDCR